ncbi:MAG TPA: DMT family transporter, partial [Solirubrobacteraceae bacterium]|nr:DMT family transporter [Solirubrobacteraceae bacterium]
TLITMVGPSRASVITYLNPAVAVVLGVTLLDESLTASAVAGMLLILAGSWLSTGGRPPGGLVSLAQGRLRPWRGRGSTTSSTATDMRPAAVPIHG